MPVYNAWHDLHVSYEMRLKQHDFSPYIHQGSKHQGGREATSVTEAGSTVDFYCEVA